MLYPSKGVRMGHSGRTVHRLDRRGTVLDWVVSPVWSEPVTQLGLDPEGSPWGADGRWVLTNGPDCTPYKERLYQAAPLTAPEQPLVVEGGPVRFTSPSGQVHSGQLGRVHTGADGLVDLSRFCFTPEYRFAVAATTLEVDQAEWRTLRLAGTGPTLLHVGGELVAHSATVSYMEPVEHEVRVWLPSGTTPVLVTSWQVGFRECRHVLRLRVGGLPVQVVLPSPGADELVAARAERLLSAVGTPSWGTRTGSVPLTGPEGAVLRVNGDQVVRITEGRAVVRLDSHAGQDLGSASMLASGEVVLRVSVDDDRSPVFREFPVAVLPAAHREEPVGTQHQWRAELLAHVARTPPSTATALVAGNVGQQALTRALWMIDNRADCADFEAVGLVTLLHRVPAANWSAGLRETAVKSLLGFKYWIDQPGLDAMCYFTENHQLVWHTAELLIGEHLAEEVFANTGWTGRRHAEHGAGLAREWIARKLAGGFSEFDSNAYLAIDTLALVSIVEFTQDADLASEASRLLDKVLLRLATNSWRGVHGCAHGRSYVHPVRSSRFEESAPIMWLCWGTGALNSAVLPATALALARRYRIPVVPQLPSVWLGRQHSEGQYRQHHDLLSRTYAADTVVYKTPEVMLASVEDYRCGLPGLQEHVWGATLGPETQVYVNHPANSATSSSARPNAWAGNRILPRVRQHRELLLAVYTIPEDDPMGFTHAWFPTSTMDEWTQRGPWTVGRRGNGCVALATEGGARLTRTGPDAYQELRPRGTGTAWVCVVGSGPLEEFAAGLPEPEFTVDGVSCGGHELTWDGP